MTSKFQCALAIIEHTSFRERGGFALKSGDVVGEVNLCVGSFLHAFGVEGRHWIRHVSLLVHENDRIDSTKRFVQTR